MKDRLYMVNQPRQQSPSKLLHQLLVLLGLFVLPGYLLHIINHTVMYLFMSCIAGIIDTSLVLFFIPGNALQRTFS